MFINPNDFFNGDDCNPIFGRFDKKMFGNKHVYIHCPKNIKSDIDGIIDYLSEANHNILVGFSEENRQKIRERMKKPKKSS